MGVICEEMLKRRAEHNEGILHSLEELVLQEEGIMEINKVLGTLCPNLKILYLPNNLIGKLGNLHRLKQLQYLNLAVNNIQKIEGLQQCEALEKLDLTLNFVGKKELPSVASLQANIHIKDLFLTGNPCQEMPGYRSYVIAMLPSLKRLDGIEVKPSERILAKQELEVVEKTFLTDDEKVCESLEDVDEHGNIVRQYTPASRLAEHAELEEKKAKENTEKKNEPKPSRRRKGFDPLPAEGKIYQKNEGNWDFKLTESECGRKIILDVAAGRFMDTSAMEIDIQPFLVRVLIKGKLLQLRLPEEVKTAESQAQRSTITGHLVVTMPKAVVKKHVLERGSYHLESAGKKGNKGPRTQTRHVELSEVHNIVSVREQVTGNQYTLVDANDEVPPLE